MISLRHLARAFTFVAALCVVAGSARAQSSSIYVERAQLSGRPYDGFVVWRPYMPEKMRFYGALALNYTLNPLRAESVTDGITATNIDNLIKQRFTTDATLGLALWHRLSLDVNLPFVAYQVTGKDPQGDRVGSGGISDTKSAIADVRLDARVLVFEANDSSFRLGTGGAVWIGNGSPLGFVTDGDVTGWLFANTEFDLGDAILVAHAGPHFRPNRSIEGEKGTLVTGTELRWAVGALVPMRDDTLRLGASLSGTQGLNSGASGTGNTAIEWLFETRFALNQAKDLFLHAGGGNRLSTGYGAPDVRALASISFQFGVTDSAPTQKVGGYKGPPRVDDYAKDTDKDGYPDDIDRCPKVKEDHLEPKPSDGCPRPPDRDGDGVFDKDDRCPDVPEDKDGVQDGDGCPEDNDNDGIADIEDACPEKPGPPNSDPEKNGCPLLTMVEDGEVKLLKPIEFEYNKAAIRAVSFPILDEVVWLMKSRPAMKIGVYGHTDNRGGEQYNLKLSDGRAAAVLDYLVSKGVASSRLESKGFGPTKPIASNATEPGRARNRRVEFKILADEGMEAPASKTPDAESPEASPAGDAPEAAADDSDDEN